MTKKRFLLSLFFAKFIFCFISWYIIGGMTQLGDTQSYLAGEFLHRNDWSSTAFIMSYFGSKFSSLVGYNVIANFPLLLLGFYGIYLSVKRLDLQRAEWLGLLILLCMPSTLMWTSIHSKEAVLNFLLGAFALLLMKRLDGEQWTKLNKLAVVMLISLIGFFKPLYLAPVLWFLFYTLSFGSRVKKLYLTLTVLIISIITFVYVMLAYQPEFSSFLNVFHRNFSIAGELTRVGNVWTSVGQFFTDAVGGMFIAFIGPTISEAFEHKKLFPFFIEGVFSLFIIIYLIIKGATKNGNLYVHSFFMLMGGVLLFFLAQYPLGYFNPGSALRYKQSFQPFLFVMLFYFAYGKSVRDSLKSRRDNNVR